MDKWIKENEQDLYSDWKENGYPFHTFKGYCVKMYENHG